MPRLKAANDAKTVLVQTVGGSDTTIYVQDVSKFPASPFRITVDAEIMEVTAVNTTLKAFTVLRAQEGTSPTSHSIGATVENRWTAGTYGELAGMDDLAAHMDDLAAHLADTAPHSGYVAQLGTNNQGVNLFKALNQRVDTRSVTLTYDANGRLTTVTERDGGATVKTTSLGYDANNNLTTVTEQVVGKTITTTLTYTGGNLTSVTRSVT